MNLKCPYCEEQLNLLDGESAEKHLAEHIQKLRESSAEVSDDQLDLMDEEAGSHISEK